MTKSNCSCFGIVVSGGPAPGINCAISAAVIEANNRGYEVRGLVGGFKGISTGRQDAIMELTTDDVSRIATTGGSILETSRYNPFISQDTSRKFLEGLEKQRIDKLIVIGGEGSAFLSHTLSKIAPHLRIAHLPKTIDNDLILPHSRQSFGFATARYAGARILETLMVDSKSCGRWFIVTSMGRRAGFLALGLGMASGTTLTLIPEEFADRLYSPDDITEIVFASMKRRVQQNKPYGVAVLAEGILDRLDPKSSPLLQAAQRDELGRLRYSELELSDIIVPALRARCKREGLELTINTKNIGYELRCHAPIAYDIEYTKFLGFGAVEYLLSGKTGIVVTWDGYNLGFEPIANMLDAQGHMRSRTVELSSDLYKIARRYMIR